MQNDFTVGIYLKSYVSKHLTNLFGDPVNLYHESGRGRELRYLMLDSLRKPCYKYEKRIHNHSFEVETRFVISNNDFYHYGWYISKTDMLRMNSRVEAKIKLAMRNFIAFQQSYGISISDSIKSFRDYYNFDEDCFPYETIKKDFYRNNRYFNYETMQNLMDAHKEIFVEQMSEIILLH
jgi:hypothetical protein